MFFAYAFINTCHTISRVSLVFTLKEADVIKFSSCSLVSYLGETNNANKSDTDQIQTAVINMYQLLAYTSFITCNIL